MLRSAPENRPRRSPITLLADIVLWPMRRLTASEAEAATIRRIFRSKHVGDLRLVMAFAILFLLAAVAIGGPLSWHYQAIDLADQHPNAPPMRAWPHFVRTAKDFLTFFGPILAGVGAVVAWAYQTGSARLGVVDLFACEISTLCRVSTVIDTVRARVEQFEVGAGDAPGDKAKTGEPPHPFTSQESYFPVFEANASALQSLEAKVVIHITAFYTFMKSVRDSARGLAAAAPDANDRLPYAPGLQLGPWRTAMRTLIYMLFLGLEAGRKSIRHLVEFEPEEAERTLVILIGELLAYRFLMQQYPDPMDVHHRRIALREADYRRDVPALIVQVAKYYDKAEEGARSAMKVAAHNPASTEDALRRLMTWEAAHRLIPEVWERYAEAGLATGDRKTVLDLPAVGKAASKTAVEAARAQMKGSVWALEPAD